MSDIILSFCIATYNRKDILLDKVKRMLSIDSSEFNIFVLDDCSDDGTANALEKIGDRRLHFCQNSERQGLKEDGVIKNWYALFEMCDGQFAFHLNDRDLIDIERIPELIQFLKASPNLGGGISTSKVKEYMVYDHVQAFLQIPYMAEHPTGIIFNTAFYRAIADRANIFSKKYSYIHPHDMILGRLSEKHKMFCCPLMWSFANSDNFKNNKSFLYKKYNPDEQWYSPKARLAEYQLFVKDIEKLHFDKEEKEKKYDSVSRRYLFLSTINYAYFLSDEGQAGHYGIEPIKLSFCKQSKIAVDFCQKSYHILSDVGYHKPYFIFLGEMYLFFAAVYVLKPIRDRLRRK